MELLVIEFWSRSEILLMCLCWLAWTGHRVLIRWMALMLINLWYLLILVKNWRWRNLRSDCWNDWRRNNWNWCLYGIWRKLKSQVWKAINLFREVNRNLTRFNPVVLEFWKCIWFASDKFVDFAIVKRIPQNFFFF